MKKLLIVAVSTALLASSLPAAAQMGMLKKAKSLTSSSDAGVGDLTSQQTGIVNRLVSGMTNMTAGQAQILRALGLKESADKLEAESDALSSGNVKDKDGIKRSMKVSEDAQEAINTKMAEETVIDAEAKKEFGKALPFYAKGTADTIRLLPELKKWASSASSTMKGAGIRELPKLKKTLGTGLFVAKNLPKYAKKSQTSYKALSDFSKKNEIDTSEADDMLGDL